jgi:hypothetical protein
VDSLSVRRVRRPARPAAALLARRLGTTWPSLREAFARHGLGMPTRNPQALRQRAIEAARQRSGRPATPSLDRCLWRCNPKDACTDLQMSIHAPAG